MNFPRGELIFLIILTQYNAAELEAISFNIKKLETASPSKRLNVYISVIVLSQQQRYCMCSLW